jgi:multidrug resistance efflux pump
MALADIENAALTAERDALQAAVDRVKALADNWVCDCDRGPEGQHRAYCSAFDADNVRAALAGAPAEQRKANDG